MAFDPDAYLAEKGQTVVSFDPNAYLAEKGQTVDTVTSFDPDTYLQEKQIEQESERNLLDTAIFVAEDFANQFNNSIANLAGAPVDLIAFGLNKASNAIYDENIISPDAFGGSETFRKAIQFLSFGKPVRDEPAKTKVGYLAQVLGEAVGFTVPTLKVAQVASRTQATTRAGQLE